MAYISCNVHTISGISRCFRLMSMYPSHFVNPIVNKDLQEVSKNSLSHIPIKAAANNVNDAIFYNELKQKVVNHITKKGNSSLAKKLLSDTFEIIKRTQIERLHLAKADKDINTNSESLLITAIENSRPLLHLSAIKRGGVKYQVPVPLTEKKSYFLAIKWLLEAAHEKDRKVTFSEKLAWEILDAAYGHGRVIKRKDDLHKQCESNRAYAHYRWS